MEDRREAEARSSSRFGAPWFLRSDLTGQSGSILLFVLAVVLVLSLAVVVVLNMSLNSDVTANKLQASTQNDHRIDGVLEDATNTVRNDPSTCAAGITVGQYDVVCTAGTSSEPDTRVLDLLVTKSSDPSTVTGKARLKVADHPTVGYTLEVCDWLLGRSITEDLQGCST